MKFPSFDLATRKLGGEQEIVEGLRRMFWSYNCYL